MAGAGEFRFLDTYNVELRPLLNKAQALLASDPDTPYLSAVVCRRFVELLANEVAKRNALPLLGQNGDPKEQLGAFIWRLNQAGVLAGKRGSFDDVREAGNAIHANSAIAIGDARRIVDTCKDLARWFDGTAQRAPAKTGSREGFAFPSLGVFALLIVLGIGTAWYLVSVGYIANPLAPPPAVAVFAQPQAFVVTPGGRALHANVRSRADANAEVKQVLSRGDQVSGIGRVVGADGATWIELAGDAGFIKESVLRAATPAPGAP